MLELTVQSTAWAFEQCSQALSVILGVPCAGAGAGLNPDVSLPTQRVLWFYENKTSVSSVINFLCAQEIQIPLKAMAEILVFSRVQEIPPTLCLYKIVLREWQTLQSFRAVLGNKLLRNPQVFYVVLCIISTNESALVLQKKAKGLILKLKSMYSSIKAIYYLIHIYI